MQIRARFVRSSFVKLLVGWLADDLPAVFYVRVFLVFV
jgi:hypothetical protein